MKYSIGSNFALINVERTMGLYTTLDRPTQNSCVMLDFSKVLRKIEPAVNGYFGSLGIDPYVTQALSVECVSVSAEKQLLICSGYLPFVADNEKELLVILNDRNERADFPEVICTDLGFNICFDIWNKHAALFFVKTVPLIKGKYENNDK